MYLDFGDREPTQPCCKCANSIQKDPTQPVDLKPGHSSHVEIVPTCKQCSHTQKMYIKKFTYISLFDTSNVFDHKRQQMELNAQKILTF